MEKILAEQAALELGAVDTNQILTLLECPVCLDHITPPIKQCIKGHLVCTDCFPRLPHCPTCRSTMSAERNLGMEQVSRLLNFPCRYHPMGCKVATSLNKKGEHERSCDYLQLKCPFHGQCSFQGALTMVVPHLRTDHNVNPAPIRPSGILFYRAKQFAKRNLWNFIFEWDGNMFRFMIKNIHANSVGRTDNCNIVIAHVQYVGPDSMAAQYAYSLSLFDADRRRPGPKFEGVVSSTMKPIESQVAKEEVFVATTYTARDYTDQFGQLNFVIHMQSLKEKEKKAAERRESEARRQHRTDTSRPPPPREAAPAAAHVQAVPVVPAAVPTAAVPVVVAAVPAAVAAVPGDLPEPASSIAVAPSETNNTSGSTSQPSSSHSSATNIPASTTNPTSTSRDESPQPGPSHLAPL